MSQCRRENRAGRVMVSSVTFHPAGLVSNPVMLSDSVTAQVLPTVIGNAEIIYQSEDGTLYFKNEPYEQM